MKYEQYVSLIKQLEAAAAADRKRYELKVVGLAMVGYGYFFLLIGLFLLVPVLLIGLLILNPEAVLKLLLWTAKLWWAAIPAIAIYFGFLGGALGSFVRKVPEPEYRELKMEEAPGLFQFIRETCSRLDAQMPRRIYVTDEFNASVVTVPRRGLFGRRVYMALGLPLMKALSPEQFRAVIAHEIGHISGKHGGFGKWAYQLHESWNMLIDAQETSGNRLASLYEGFVKWFFPYFGAYTFVLMREHEKEADEYAVDVAGNKALGEALIALGTRSAYLEEKFWAEINEENRRSATPSANVFARMLASLETSDPELERKTIEKNIRIPTDYNDTHPSLADRLRAISYWDGNGLPAIAAVSRANAAKFYLGSSLPKMIDEFEAAWTEQIAMTWKARYDGYQRSGSRFQELEAKGGHEELSVEELLEKAGIIAERDGSEKALPLLETVVERSPDNSEGLFHLGRILLEQENDEGLAHLRKLIQNDQQWKYAASEAAFQYLRFHGRLDDAKEFAAILDAEAEENAQAQSERESISTNDAYTQHQLEAKTVEEMVQKIRYYDEIEKLYMVRKLTHHYKDIPFHVLLIKLSKKPLFGGGNYLKPEELLDVVVQRLEGFGIGYFALLQGEFAQIEETAKTIPGALVYSSERSDHVPES